MCESSCFGASVNNKMQKKKIKKRCKNILHSLVQWVTLSLSPAIATMFPEALTRTFKPIESNYPFIIPALRNGLTVTVTPKIAREFKLANPGIIVKGTCKYISFEKADLGLVNMFLAK